MGVRNPQCSPRPRFLSPAAESQQMPSERQDRGVAVKIQGCVRQGSAGGQRYESNSWRFRPCPRE